MAVHTLLYLLHILYCLYYNQILWHLISFSINKKCIGLLVNLCPFTYLNVQSTHNHTSGEEISWQNFCKSEAKVDNRVKVDSRIKLFIANLSQTNNV